MEQIPLFDIYQKKGLLPSLGSSDEIYMKLKASADDLVEAYIQDPAKVIKYTLVAIDNGITEAEPIMEEVENIISAKWQMLRSHFSVMPIVLYRAVMLDALSKLIAKDAKFASAIWFTAIDVFPLFDIPHKELSVLKEFFEKLGEHVEEVAVKEWTIERETFDVKLPKFEIKLATTKPKVSEADLKEEMIAASGPQGQDGAARVNPNTVWPNSAQSWSYQFAPRAAKGIAAVVNKAISQQSNSMAENADSLQLALNKYFVDLGQNIETALKNSIQSSVAVERRSQLLWWKETLYSKSQHKSYRKMTPFEASIAMAFDIYYLLPTFFPVSVDYVVKEAFNLINGDQDNEIKLIDFLSEVCKSEQAEFLSNYFDNEPTNEDRTDISTYMQKLINSKVDLKADIVRSLGISPDKTVRYEEISVWILHSLSAKHLLNPKR